MKKIMALLCLCFASMASFAQLTPYSVLIYQANDTGDSYWGRYFYPPTITTSGFLMYDGISSQPKFGSIGSGLSWDGVTLSASGGSPTGSAGGDLTGTYPSPTLTTSGVAAGAYSRVTVDAKGRVTSGTNRSFNYVTRAVNTCVQLSSTRDALVSYTVEIATNISLSGGGQGTVYLRTYTNSSCSTGTQEITRVSNGQSGALTIGLNITQTLSLNFSGVIPAGTWTQIVTETNTGSPTFTPKPGQETLF